MLLDDSFSAVPEVLQEGRRVIANIERVANLFVTKTAYASLIAIAAVVSTLPFPFYPRHLTVVSTLTIGVPGFFLALAPGAPRAHPGFTRRVLRFATPAGTAAAVAAFSSYAIVRALPSTSQTEARTAAMLALFVLGIWVLVLVARPLDGWRILLVAAMSAGIVVPFAFPGLRNLLAFELPTGTALVVTAGIAVLAIGGLTVARWWTDRGSEPPLPLRPRT